MKRLVQPAVVQMNVVSVTDVHDVALLRDAPLPVAATGKATPGEECSLLAEAGRGGFEELNTGEYAPTCIQIHYKQLSTGIGEMPLPSGVLFGQRKHVDRPLLLGSVLCLSFRAMILFHGCSGGRESKILAVRKHGQMWGELGKGCPPPAVEVRGSTPGKVLKMFGQHPALWFVLGKEMCSLMLNKNISTTSSKHYWMSEIYP